MERRQLEENVRQSVEEGYTFKEIRQAMIEDGYSRDIVDNILSEFKQSGQNPTDQSSKSAQPQNQNHYQDVQSPDQNQDINQKANNNSPSRSKSQSSDQRPTQDSANNRNSGNNQPQRSDQTGSGDKSRQAAAILAIILGAFGAHKFYLGETRKGVLYLCFGWTSIPWILAVVQATRYLKASDREFQKKYVQQ